MTAETTTAGAGAASPGSFHDPGKPECDRECPCVGRLTLELLLLRDDLWEEDEEKADIRSFHDAPLIASLSFHESDVVSKGSIVVTAFPLPFFPLIGIAIDSVGLKLFSPNPISSFGCGTVHDSINELPSTFPRECDKDVGGVLKLLHVSVPLEVDADVDAIDDEDEDVPEGEFKLMGAMGAIWVGLMLGVDLLIVRGSTPRLDEDKPLGTFGALVLILETVLPAIELLIGMFWLI